MKRNDEVQYDPVLPKINYGGFATASVHVDISLDHLGSWAAWYYGVLKIFGFA
jgi:hypothetical protein